MITAMKTGWRFLLVLCLLPAILVACGGSSTSGGSLTGVTWQLTDVTFDGQSTSHTITKPDQYTIAFQNDGTATVKADCNTAHLNYSTNGNQLTITAGPMTLVYCGSDSLSNEFVHALQQAATYSLQNDTLTINSGSNGTMQFKKS